MTRRLTAGLLALALLAGPALAADAPRNTKPYPAELRDSFVTGCTQTGLAKPACDCFLRLLEREWTVEEMIAFSAKTEAEPHMQPPPIMVRIINACAANPDVQALD